MTPAPRTPRIDLTGHCLLLADAPAPGVDVVVLDLTDVAPDAVADLVRSAGADHQTGVGARAGTSAAVGAALDAGVGLVILDVATVAADEVAAVTAAGVVVVLHHRDPAAAVAAIDHLHAAGVDATRVVVEVGPGTDVVPAVTMLDRTAFGFRVGAAVDGAEGGVPSSAAGRDGWEIGTLTALLELGVATVRGVAAERFRRVTAVLHEIDAAVTPDDAALADGPGGAPSSDVLASNGTVAP